MGATSMKARNVQIMLLIVKQRKPVTAKEMDDILQTGAKIIQKTDGRPYRQNDQWSKKSKISFGVIAGTMNFRSKKKKLIRTMEKKIDLPLWFYAWISDPYFQHRC